MKPCDKGLATFTPRQIMIIECAAQGFRPKNIADILGLTLSTVNSDIRTIYKKTPAKSLTQALAILYGIEDLQNTKLDSK
jgi:DNA-binding CsgD family transcriptional regulator